MTAATATVVEGTVEEGRDVSEVVTRSVVVALGAKAVVETVVLRVAAEGVAPLVVAVLAGAVAAAAAAVEGGDDAVAIAVAVVSAGVVLLDRVTYAKGVAVGGRDTPGGHG